MEIQQSNCNVYQIENAEETRYLVLHVRCEPKRFTNLDSALKCVEEIKQKESGSPDIYELDLLASGWHRIEITSHRSTRSGAAIDCREQARRLAS